MSGYVRIFRRVLDNPAFKTDAEAMAFAWMVLRAAWKPCSVRYKGKVIDLERSQLAMSVRDMADRLEWSKSRVCRYLNTVQKRDMIKLQGGTGVNIITICNYDEYQLSGSGDGTEAGQSLGQERDSSGTQNNKENKYNKDNITSLRSVIVASEGDDDTEQGNHETDEPDDIPSYDEQYPVVGQRDQIDEAIQYWNLAASRYGWPTVKIPINATRRGKLKSRIREKGIEGWKDALRRAWAGYLGRDPPAWFTFDWLVKNENNIDKVLEGNYDKGFNGSEDRNRHPAAPSDALLRASIEIDQQFAARQPQRPDILAIPDTRTGNDR